MWPFKTGSYRLSTIVKRYTQSTVTQKQQEKHALIVKAYQILQEAGQTDTV